jgi:hypothetical protein
MLGEFRSAAGFAVAQTEGGARREMHICVSGSDVQRTLCLIDRSRSYKRHREVPPPQKVAASRKGGNSRVLCIMPVQHPILIRASARNKTCRPAESPAPVVGLHQY